MTTTFTLPRDAEATAPPEWQGLERDEVRLLAVRPDGLTHAPVPRPARTCSSPATSSWSTRPATLPGAARAPGGPTASSSRCTCRRRWTTAAGWSRSAARTTTGRTSASSPARCSRCPAASGSRCSRAIPDPRGPRRLWRAAHGARRRDDRLPAGARAADPATATCAGSFPLAAYQNVYADRAGQRGDGQRRAAVHRAAARRAGGPRHPRRPADRCTPASPAPSCTSRRTPSGSPSRRSPPGW